MLINRAEEEIAKTREHVSTRSWTDFSRKGFIYQLANVLPHIQEIYTLFQLIRNEMEKKAEAGKPELGEFLKEINKHITILKRNQAMEEEKSQKAMQDGIQTLADEITMPELYADLEQKTMSLLLKSANILERIRLFERKKEPIMQTRAAQRNVLDLLEKRETELQNLRKKYEETRKNMFFGLIEKESANDVEKELGEISRQLEAKTAVAKKMFEAEKNTFENLQKQMQEMEARINEVEELETRALGKTFELITMLKKERDYAKKILMELEHDTLQLRNSYSKELLGLQEEKMQHKNTLEDKFQREIEELKKEVREKNELLRHFHETVVSKEQKIQELENSREQKRKPVLILKEIEKKEEIKAKRRKKRK